MAVENFSFMKNFGGHPAEFQLLFQLSYFVILPCYEPQDLIMKRQTFCFAFEMAWPLIATVGNNR